MIWTPVEFPESQFSVRLLSIAVSICETYFKNKGYSRQAERITCGTKVKFKSPVGDFKTLDNT